ncbi:hypothetical protein RHSIM_Rhsim06G0052700 [Rhododendron simsii]|uniref:RING-type E3 ubiquitin transferase n=1 Tax=Rhododendron simsii TaxID=118357 RepID=A0A834GW06_RHOSS|nr:hypothetical protein RHSIM_Rhsim06G0052700 [Rhododendron simsii]
MQGQRSAIGSLPETIGFDQGSSSSEAAMDQQLCWNNMQNPAHNMLPDFITSTNDPASAYLSQGHTLSGWNVGEPSSRVTLNHVSHNNERKTEHVAGSAPEEHPYELASTLLLNSVNVNRISNQIPNAPFFVQSSNNGIAQDLNASAGFLGHGDDDDCQIMESNNAYKSNILENARFQSASSSSHPFGMPTGSGGYLAGESDGRPSSSLEGRRLSCKRKAMEGNPGQSSMSGNSTYFQPSDRSPLWNGVPGRYNAGTSLSISTPSPNVPLEILGGGGASSGNPLSLSMTGNGENPHRNYRVRINPSRRQDSVPAAVFPAASTVLHSNVSSQPQSSRLLPIGNSFDNTNPQMQSGVVHVPPPLRRTSQSSRWSSGSSSRAGERDAMLHEEPNSITMPRNISEHPIFVPPHEVRNSPQNSGSWNLTGGNMSIAGNVASSSRTGSSSGVHPLPGPSWVPHRNPPRYPRRLQELVRRSLLSSAGSESVDPSSSNSAVQLGSSSREMALSSGNGNQGHHLSHSRSSLSLHRQLDGALGVPYSLRTLAAAGEGRSRLVSEIRSVLDLMRRGEGLRFEDVMILDQSVFFGMPDIHDRHRDMRLDVDNMSYEELLALEERIGNVSTGLSEDFILNRLKQRKYFSIAMSAHLEVEPCCVCQEEYKDGEDIGTLECGHEFHSGCIKQWLLQKNLCPICKTTALNK